MFIFSKLICGLWVLRTFTSFFAGNLSIRCTFRQSGLTLFTKFALLARWTFCCGKSSKISSAYTRPSINCLIKDFNLKKLWYYSSSWRLIHFLEVCLICIKNTHMHPHFITRLYFQKFFFDLNFIICLMDFIARNCTCRQFKTYYLENFA